MQSVEFSTMYYLRREDFLSILERFPKQKVCIKNLAKKSQLSIIFEGDFLWNRRQDSFLFGLTATEPDVLLLRKEGSCRRTLYKPILHILSEQIHRETPLDTSSSLAKIYTNKELKISITFLLLCSLRRSHEDCHNGRGADTPREL